MNIASATIFRTLDETGDGVLQGHEVRGRHAQVLQSLVGVREDQFEGVLQARKVPDAVVVQTAAAIEAQEEAAARITAPKVGAFFAAIGLILLNLVLLPLSLAAFSVLALMIDVRFAAAISFSGFVLAGGKFENEMNDDVQQGQIRYIKETFLHRDELNDVAPARR